MKQKMTNPVFQVILLCSLLLLVASLGYSAESTEDVPADAALKEKVREQIMGGAGAKPVEEEYRIGYRDILNVNIYGEGSMATNEGIQTEEKPARGEASSPGSGLIRGRDKGIEVRTDGRVSLRHIGDVTVVGMTLTQLADYLKQLYSTIYDKPSVTVTLVQSNSQQYTVMGQVVKPGLYNLDFPITIVKAVASAGGFTEWAKSEITVIRQESPGAAEKNQNAQSGKTFKFDYDEFLKGQNLEKNIIIKPGDVIVVH